eukprot:5360711-Prymnesium_polylepis.1
MFDDVSGTITVHATRAPGDSVAEMTCGIEIRTRQVRTRNQRPPPAPAAPQTSERVQRVCPFSGARATIGSSTDV